MAHAPSSAARLASSRFVMPQIFTRVIANDDGSSGAGQRVSESTSQRVSESGARLGAKLSLQTMPSSFRHLVAYQLAASLANDVHARVREWPSLDRWSSGIQLIRSTDSVGANIAEAIGRWHTPDRRRLLMIARGSLYESEHWLLQAEARGLLPNGINERIDEVARTLNGLIRAPGSNSLTRR